MKPGDHHQRIQIRYNEIFVIPRAFPYTWYMLLSKIQNQYLNCTVRGQSVGFICWHFFTIGDPSQSDLAHVFRFIATHEYIPKVLGPDACLLPPFIPHRTLMKMESTADEWTEQDEIVYAMFRAIQGHDSAQT